MLMVIHTVYMRGVAHAAKVNCIFTFVVLLFAAIFSAISHSLVVCTINARIARIVEKFHLDAFYAPVEGICVGAKRQSAMATLTNSMCIITSAQV